MKNNDANSSQDVQPEAFDSEACPGCGCSPGDGYTADCTDPNGCGFFKDNIEPKLTRVGDIEVGKIDFDERTVSLIDKSGVSVLPVLKFTADYSFGEYAVSDAEMKRLTDIKTVSLTVREVDGLQVNIDDEIQAQS